MLAFATKKPSTGDNHDGQREDAASPFIRTALIELSLVDSEVTEAAAVSAGHRDGRWTSSATCGVHIYAKYAIT